MTRLDEVMDIKCMVVGDVLVGKTSFLLRVMKNEYPAISATVYDDYTFYVRLRNGKQVIFSFWDVCKSCSFLCPC